jgi:rfaE bifunctional protein nucleotidyltransferase chain/domain
MSAPGPKILAQAELAERLAKHRERGEAVVLCHGVFDLLHPGHIRSLESAAEQGDVLVVTLASDATLARAGARPVLNQRLRAEILAALQCVDHVSVCTSDSAADAIRALRPDVYVQSSAASGVDSETVARLAEERAAAEASGTRLHLVEQRSFSSAHLLNANFEVISPEADAYLRELAARWTPDAVCAQLERLRGLRVLVVGDAILDEYQFCRSYGKASKSSAISAQFQRSELYAGGALAVANHVAGFCDDVRLLTCLGAQDEQREFVASHLKPNVAAQFVSRSDAPTTLKRRFVEDFLMTKFFELSFFNDRPLPPTVEAKARDFLGDVAGSCDLLLVADFGHGMMTPALVETACEKARFLALNTQLNSINMGYNVITRYPRADYACIDEAETRLAARDRFRALPELTLELATELGCTAFTATRGKSGSLTWSRREGFLSTPVLSREVVDTIGAGDAFLSITAPAACAGLSAELLGFLGNAVGALAVRIVGNRESVEPDALRAYVRSLLGR